MIPQFNRAIKKTGGIIKSSHRSYRLVTTCFFAVLGFLLLTACPNPSGGGVDDLSQDSSLLGTYDSWTYTAATGWLKVDNQQLVIAADKLSMSGANLFPPANLKSPKLGFKDGQISLVGLSSGGTQTVHLFDYFLQDAAKYGTTILWLKTEATSGLSLTAAPDPATAIQSQVLCYIPVGKTPGAETGSNLSLTKDANFLGSYLGTLCVSNANIIYSANYNNGSVKILSYDASGNKLAEITRSSDTSFGYPDLVTDKNGNLYSFDGQTNIAIRQPDGTLVRRFGGNYPSNQDLVSGKSLVVDATGNIFATGKDNTILKFSSNGTLLKTFGGTGVENGKLNITSGAKTLALDSSGNLFVLDKGNSRIQKFDNTGTFLLSIPVADQTNSILIDSADKLYILYGSKLQNIDTAGAVLSSADIGEYGVPVFDAAGNLYLGMGESNAIYKYSRATPLVVPAATAIALSPSTMTLITGGADSTLALSTTPANVRVAVTWKSSSDAIAKVSSTGVVTAVGAGTATISATTSDGSKTASSTVTVTVPANPTSLVATAGDDQVALSWSNPTDSDFASVEISWTPTGGNPTQPSTVTKPGTSQTITGLAAGTSYSFTVKAMYEDGKKSSGASVSVSTTTKLAVSVVINASAEAPATMTVPSTITKGNALAFTVSETFDSYQWYLDGTASGTTKSGSIDTAILSPGLHELSLFAMKNGELTTKSCRFTVSN